MHALQSQKSVWMSSDITGEMYLHNFQMLSMCIALINVKEWHC